jgi:hypothetical protein
MGLYLASWLPALALLAVAAWLFLPDAVAAARRPRNNAKRA